MASPMKLVHHQLIAKHDIVVIGTSAGGVPALQTLAAGLPSTLKASVFIVMHIPSTRRSELPDILRLPGGLPVSNPENNEQIVPGRIYVAPADFHLLIERDQRITLWRGPRENHFRPAINPTFRSAADVYGSRVVGVVMTGNLDDGVAGLAWIKRHGGLAVVQDPYEATFPNMPQTALDHVQVDYVMRVSGLAPLLVQLANGAAPVH